MLFRISLIILLLFLNTSCSNSTEIELDRIHQLEMVALLSKNEFQIDEEIEIELSFKNLTNRPIYFQREGDIRAMFLIGGQEKRLLQSVRARYKRKGLYKSLILPLQPKETWNTTFSVNPRNGELPAGSYPVKVYYQITDRYTLPQEGYFEGALTGTVISNKFTVRVND